MSTTRGLHESEKLMELLFSGEILAKRIKSDTSKNRRNLITVKTG